MSENDLRQEMDKWECELMAEDMARLRQERDDAVAAEAAKAETILIMEDQVQRLKKSIENAASRAKRKKYESLRNPSLFLVLFAAAWALVAAGTQTQLISNIIGEPMIAAMIAGCAYCAGILYERVRR